MDARADVYSLGATLYALLAGQPPFHNGTIGQKLMWHQMKEPEPVDALRPEVPAELTALVAHMLAKKPEDRIATMAEVAQVLERWATPAPVPEEHISPRRRTRLTLGSNTSQLNRAQQAGHSGPIADTLVGRRTDTAPMPSPAEGAPIVKNPLSRATNDHDERRKRLMIMLFGMGAAAFWILSGLLALLMWMM